MKKFLRKIRLYLGKVLLDKKIHGQLPLPLNPKIIVLQQDGKIGDYIVSSFIFRELKKHFPHSQLDVLCSPNNVNLFEQNPFVDHAFIVNRKASFSYTKMGNQLAKQHYDICINVPMTLRNRDLWLTRLIGAKNNIGYLKSDYQLFNLNIDNPHLHFSAIYAKAIAFCGVENSDTTYDMPDQSAQKASIAQFIQQHQLTNGIAINFFGAARSRKFSWEKMHALLAHLIQIAPNKRIMLLTYPAVNEILTQVAKHYENVFVYTPTQTIFDSIEIIKNMEWVISPDTSIVHIASGLNKKIIAFYKFSDQQNVSQWHPNAKSECHLINFNEHINTVNLNEIKSEWFNQ